VTGQAPNFAGNIAAAAALNSLYGQCVQTVAKQGMWDFTRNVATLSLSGNAAPFFWTYEYLYPTYAVEVWQIVPPTLTDQNNPLPQNWDIGNTLVNNVQTKVIWCNLQNAQAIVDNAPQESTWDVLFLEAVVRLLASELSMALFGKPDSAQSYLESGAAFEQIGEDREG